MPRMTTATARAIQVEAISGTASRMRDMKNIRAAMQNRPSTGMPMGRRLIWRPVVSADTWASQPATVTRPRPRPK